MSDIDEIEVIKNPIEILNSFDISALLKLPFSKRDEIFSYYLTVYEKYGMKDEFLEFIEKAYSKAMVKQADYANFDKDGCLKSISVNRLAEYIQSKENFEIIEPSENAKEPLFYFYNDIKGRYELKSKNAIMGLVRKYIISIDGGQDIYKPKQAEEVYKILCTLDTTMKLDGFNYCKSCINFKNGVLHLDTMRLTEHLPNYKFTTYIPYDWNEEAEDPKVFNNFLNTLTNADKETITLLLQFIGLAITNVNATEFKSCLYLFGDGNTGKSQFFHLVTNLVGEDNFYSIDLPSLEKDDFALNGTLGKRLIGYGDNKVKYISELGNFKAITGGDILSINRKGKDRIQAKYTGLVLFCGNELPNFSGDNGQWVYKRFIPVECKNVIPVENRDRKLLDKMLKEIEGIIKLAVFAYKEMENNGKGFIIPKQTNRILADYKQDNNPIISFYNNCCVMRDSNDKYTDCITCREVYETYKKWVSTYHPKLQPLSINAFNKQIVNYLGFKNTEDITKSKDHNKRKYYIFKLNFETMNEFHIETKE